jgi:LPS-assembly lipoprotein
MSWRRNIVRLAAALALGGIVAGCGFEPLYAERGTSGNLALDLASIHVSQIGERFGQIMTNELRDGFNPKALKVPPAYELSVGLRETRTDIAARADGTASRNSITLSATWNLRRLSDGQIALSGTSRAFGGHDILTNEYANVVSADTDEGRAVRDIGDEIQTRVAVYLQNLRPKT